MIKENGENSGELDNMLTRAADMQQNEATNMISTLLSLLEPLMLGIDGRDCDDHCNGGDATDC